MSLIVNAEEVPEEAISQEAQSLLERFRQLSDEQRAENGFDEETMQQRAAEWARENLIERALMRQEALADSDPIPDDVFEQALDTMYKRFGGREKFAETGMTEDDIRLEAEVTVKLDRLLGRISAEIKPAKSKDVAAYYRNHKENWTLPETVRAAHIVKHTNEEVSAKDAKAAIDDAHKRLGEGEKFEALADELSDCPGGGGDLGWFPRGKMVEDFEEVIFQMQPGEISEPFRSVFGFHIAKLHEKKPSALRPLSEVKADIEKQLQRERETKAVEAVVDSLRERATIVNTAEPSSTPEEAATPA